MYGKIVQDGLQVAPNKLPGEGVIIYNPSAEMYLKHGWYPVEFTDPPEPREGYYYTSSWEQQDDVIVQTWEFYPLPDDISEAEAYDIIFGGGGE